MKKILILILFLITYGSFYPFDYTYVSLGFQDLIDFFKIQKISSRGDILQNILLFVPYGFLIPFFCGQRDSVAQKISFTFYFLFWGFVFAVAIQILQFYFPTRSAVFFDGIVNLIGSIFGLIFGLVLKRFILLFNLNLKRDDLYIMILLSAWVGYKLFPFIPTIDFQEVKDSLKPLLLYPNFEFLSLLGNFLSVFLIAHLFRLFSFKAPWYLSAIFVFGVIASQIGFQRSTISVNEALGAVGAFLMFYALYQKIFQERFLFLCFVIVGIFIYNLYPFQIRTSLSSFDWVPLSGFLTGSIYLNLLNVFYKLFWCGGLFFLGVSLDLSRTASAILALIVFSLIEFLQIFIDGHSAEMTDPILVLIMIFVYFATPKEILIDHEKMKIGD